MAKFLLAILAFLWAMSLFAPCCHARPQNMEQLAQIMQFVQPIPLPGPITSLYRPNYDTTREADLKLTADEPVFIAVLPDGPRIYPQQYMLWHQVVNELVNDHAYAITYCPITGTLMAYDATMQGANLIFDVEGHENDGSFYGFLYDGNSVLMDRNTGSLWLQETGMAFDGPLIGHGMPTIPVYWTNWEAAKRVYPDAPVLARPRGRRPYGRDPYGSYQKKGTYYDNDILAYAVRRLDNRFPKKTPMLCLELGNLLMAVDINYVKKNGAVNFFMGTHALLAVHDRNLDVIRIFDRQVWADPFLFILRNGKLEDLTTRSVWNTATGRAVSGNMAGATMKQYYGVYSMWFAWYSINPETLAMPGPGEVPAKLLTPAPPGIDEKGNYVDPPLPRPAPDQLPGTPTWQPN